MNKKLLAVSLVVLLVIVVSAAYVLFTKEKDISVRETSTQDGEISKSQSPDRTAARGTYVDYTASLLAEARGIKLLFFHAPWCPQCRALDESIRASELPDGVTIFKVDYDSNQPLRAKYGVTLQTTIVKVDNSGNKIESYVAYDEPTFQSVKQALLP